MLNKHGVWIIGKDEKLFGLNNVGPDEAKESQSSRPDTVSRFPILREAFLKATQSK